MFERFRFRSYSTHFKITNEKQKARRITLPCTAMFGFAVINPALLCEVKKLMITL